MARVDPHAIHQDAADAHPEWIAVDADGNKRRHWAFPDVWVTCAYGDYNAKFMPDVVAEITREYDIDAVFANRWQGHGVCYCESCRTRFKGASGHDLPTKANPEDPIWQAWTAWRRTVLTKVITRLGRRGEGDPAARQLHPEHGRRLADGVRHLHHPQALPVSGRRRSGAARHRADMDVGPQRQAHARHLPRTACRAHHLDRAGGGLSLEGFRHDRSRDPGLDDGRLRARHAAVVHQVQRRRAGQALGGAGCGDLQPPRRSRAHPRRPDADGGDRTRRPGDDAAASRAGDARGRGRRRSWLLSRADRGAAAIRADLGPGVDGGIAGPLQGRDPRQRHLPFRRSMRGAQRIRRARRERRGGVRNIDPRRNRPGARRDRPWRPPRREDDRAIARTGQEHLCRAQRQPPDFARLRRGGAHHRRHAPHRRRGCVGRHGAVPLRSRFPRPADGRGLSPRGSARRRRRRPRAQGWRANGLYPVEYRQDVLGGARRRPWPADRQRACAGRSANGRTSR